MFRPLHYFRFTLTALILSVSFQITYADSNWPTFRGPKQNGITDEGTKLPTVWGEDKNVSWKVEIKGKAWSSPVIWGDQVWVTNADEGGAMLSVMCFDKKTGKVIHKKRVRVVAAPQYCHPFNSYGSPSPVIEDDRIYVSFGAPWTGCVDTKTGEVIWERKDFKCNHFRGPGSSVFVHGELLYLNFDGSDFQYVVALNKKTGETVWKTDRTTDFHDVDDKGVIEREGDWRKAYSTCRIIKNAAGKKELISVGSMAVYAYNPETGEELWRMDSPKSHSIGATPIIGDGMVFAPIGGKGGVLAMKSEGKGVLDPEKNLVWSYNRAAPKRPSMLLIDGLLFGVSDSGIAICLDAKSGEEIWKSRVGGNFSSSPIFADGKIWLFDMDGKGTVIEAGREFKVVAENKLDAGCMGSPAVSGNAMFVRTTTHLYRIEE